MMLSVSKLSNFMLMTVHRVCGTEESVDTHPHPVTEEELAEIFSRIDALKTPEGMHGLLNDTQRPEEIVTVTGEGKNKTRTRTRAGLKV